MGTPDFAGVSLKRLTQEGYDVQAVITQPDRPKGRGKRVQSPPVKTIAIESGVRVMQPERIRDERFIEKLRCLKPDIIVVVAFGQILPKEILDLPAMGCINVHASLLPEYRGAAPINWCIIRGEKRTGVTTIYMDEGMDTGDMLLWRETLIGDDETAGQLHDRLAVMGADLLVETLEGIKGGSLQGRAQDNTKVTYAPQLERSTGEIDWNMDAHSIFNLIRGTDPWPGCYSYYDGKRIKVWKAKVVDKNSEGINGQIIGVNDKGMAVQTGRGTLLVTEIQMPSSRRMTVEEFLKGNSIRVRSILGEKQYE